MLLYVQNKTDYGSTLPAVYDYWGPGVCVGRCAVPVAKKKRYSNHCRKHNSRKLWESIVDCFVQFEK